MYVTYRLYYCISITTNLPKYEFVSPYQLTRKIQYLNVYFKRGISPGFEPYNVTENLLHAMHTLLQWINPPISTCIGQHQRCKQNQKTSKWSNNTETKTWTSCHCRDTTLVDCNRVALPLEAHEPRSAFTASNQDVSHTFCCCCCCCCFVLFVLFSIKIIAMFPGLPAHTITMHIVCTWLISCSGFLFLWSCEMRVTGMVYIRGQVIISQLFCWKLF